MSLPVLDPTLKDFIARALEHGRSEYSKSKDRITTLALGEACFGFAESQDYLSESAKHCLSEPENVALLDRVGEVYADYSGWHINGGFEYLVQRPENAIELDQQLADQGWRVSLNPERNSWDIFDTHSKFGIRLLPSVESQAEWEPTAPLAHFCRWLAEQSGLTMVHAASLAYGEKGAMLVGEGGAGKSGTVLGGLLFGLSSAGDDYTLMGKDRLFSAYRTVKQNPEGMSRLGLTANSNLNWQRKYVFRPEAIGLNSISQSAPMNAILLPQIGADRTSIYSTNTAEAFKVLTMSTLRQLGSSYTKLFQACAPTVRDLPCYKIELSPDPKEISDALKQFFHDL